MDYIENFIFHPDICDESNSMPPGYINKTSTGFQKSIKGEYKTPDDEEDDTSVQFPEYMNQLIKRQMTDRYKLADMLDIGAESLKKRLNCSKRFIAKRDLLIAICLLLYANETGINAAIRKYNKYMWRNSQQKWYPLFSRENRNERDKCIIESMNEVYRKYPTISRGIVDEINNRLISKKLGGFDLVNQYNKKGNDFICVVKEKEDNEDERYIILERGQYNLQIEDPFGYDNSLESQYNLTRADCSCMFAVRDTVTGRRYRLRFFIMHYGGETMFLDSLDDGSVKSYKTIDETMDFKSLFYDLRDYTLDHQRKLLKILDDTRNYERGSRLSANFRDNAIHVFMESYNFQFPEEHEYYLFEYSRGEYSLSVYHRSCFMANFLSVAEYNSAFGKQKPTAFESYHSSDEIDIKDEDESDREHSEAWHHREAFDTMKLKVDALLEDIKGGEKTIRDYGGPLDGDPEGPAIVCRFLGLEKDFDCQGDGDENGDIYMHGKEIAEIVDDNGTRIELTIPEVIKAYELGYHNRQEIIENKIKYGKIDEVF